MRRTTATTEYLKECMGTALLELMKEKPIEKITIEEMTAKADVGRSTYFRYFKNKDEVLAFNILCLWNRFMQKDGEFVSLSDSPAFIRFFFEFCLSIREINDMLYSCGHENAILMAYLQIAGIDTSRNSDDIQAYYVNNAAAYALYGTVNAWILRGYKETPAQMAQIARDNA